MKTSVTTRDVEDVKIIELHGKITIGAGDLQMREAIHAAVNGGATKILVDMKAVTTIDSSGVGELVGCHDGDHKGEAEAAEPSAEDQRRPDGDPAHHRVRRVPEREGRPGELRLSVERSKGSPPCSRRCVEVDARLPSFSRRRRAARPSRPAPPAARDALLSPGSAFVPRSSSSRETSSARRARSSSMPVPPWR